MTLAIFLEALRVAASSQAEVLLLASTGMAAASMGILDAETRRRIARFHFAFLNPCICLQLNQYYSLDMLRDWGWTVLCIALVHIALGAGLGWLGGCVMGFSARQRSLLTLTTAFGNVAALPFVLIVPIVLTWSAATEGSRERGLSVIGLYLLAWIYSFFTAGLAFVGRLSSEAAKEAAKATDEEAKPVDEEAAKPVDEASKPIEEAAAKPAEAVVTKQRVLACLRRIDPNLGWMALTVFLGCIPALRDALSPKGALNWMGSAWSSLGTTGITLSSSILGAGLWSAWRQARIGRFVVAACVLRLLLLPAICLPLHLALRHASLIPQDPVLLMVLSISAGTPSAQTLVMLFNARGATELAAEASKVYVPMYAMSVLTVSALTVAVCLIVGEESG